MAVLPTSLSTWESFFQGHFFFPPQWCIVPRHFLMWGRIGSSPPPPQIEGVGVSGCGWVWVCHQQWEGGRACERGGCRTWYGSTGHTHHPPPCLSPPPPSSRLRPALPPSLPPPPLQPPPQCSWWWWGGEGGCVVVVEGV